MSFEYASLAAGTTIVHPLNPNVSFSIPMKKIHCPLVRAEASKLTPEGLSAQLNSIGLNCPYTKPEFLAGVVNDARKNLPAGAAQAFHIDKTENVNGKIQPVHLTKYMEKVSSLPSRKHPDLTKVYEQHKVSTMAASGNSSNSSISSEANAPWEPSVTAAGYSAKLSSIYAHFDDLNGNYESDVYPFPGHKSEDHVYEGKYGTVDAIRTLFVDTATNMSSACVMGVDKLSMEAVFSNAIAPLGDHEQDLANYDRSDDRLVFLVMGPNEDEKTVDGIGFVHVSWRLIIKDYRKKEKDALQHDTKLSISACSAMYSDLDSMAAHLAWLQQKTTLFTSFAIPVIHDFQVLEKRPLQATDLLWNKAIPLESKGERLTAILLYAPSMTALGCLSNHNSKASSTYTLSTTSGFSWSMGQRIQSTFSSKVDVLFFKGKAEISAEISFTEQWNRSQTETISFQVPAGEKAFIYKGTIQSKYIYYDPADQIYSFGPEGVFYTNYIYSSADALPDASGPN